MSGCPDCTQAAQRPHHGFHAGCPGCAARAVSRGPNYRASQAQGSQTRTYRRELEQFGLTHEQVRQAAKADQLEAAK